MRQFFVSGQGVRSPDFWALPAYQKLVLVSVLFVPFQYALTVDVGFPFKISELCIILAACAFVLQPRTWRSAWTSDQLFVSVLLATVVVSTGAALVGLDAEQVVPGVTRSLRVDLIAYCIYAFFVAMLWFMLRRVSAGLTVAVLMQSLWLCAGAVVIQAVGIAAGWQKFIHFGLGFDVHGRGQEIFGILFARSGPFLEGQHLGFYAGALFVLAIYTRRVPAAVVAGLCLVYSQSTTGILGIGVAVVVTTLFRPTKRAFIVFGAGATLAAVAALVVPQLRAAVVFQAAKLGIGPRGSDAAVTQSLDVRAIKSDIGWRMMWDYPVGTGPGRYAAHFNEYWRDYPLPDYYYQQKIRAIAENAYMQIGSENGVVALAAFACLILWLAFRIRTGSSAAVALLAFTTVGAATQSSWTFLPIWVFLAVVSAHAADPRRGALRSDRVAQDTREKIATRSGSRQPSPADQR